MPPLTFRFIEKFGVGRFRSTPKYFYNARALNLLLLFLQLWLIVRFAFYVLYIFAWILYNKCEVIVMDTVKIGKFLSQLRHERELTQEQLAERLGTSNKTISRWENGNYMPPVEMLMELSEFYGVSINEILSGRRLEETDVKSAADENLKSVLEESPFTLEEKKNYFTKKWKKEHWYSFVIPAVIALFFIIVSTLRDLPLGVFIGCLIPIPARIVSYNMMMSYVEGKVFNIENDIDS